MAGVASIVSVGKAANSSSELPASVDEFEAVESDSVDVEDTEDEEDEDAVDCAGLRRCLCRINAAPSFVVTFAIYRNNEFGRSAQQYIETIVVPC